MSTEKKFQIPLEAQSGDKPVGELLRREGLYYPLGYIPEPLVFHALLQKVIAAAKSTKQPVPTPTAAAAQDDSRYMPNSV